MEQLVFMCFIDFEKVSERDKHDAMIRILQQVGIDDVSVGIFIDTNMQIFESVSHIRRSNNN